jgi:hypothetical protein
MPAAQARLPLGMPFRPRARNVRRPFMPSCNGGPYRLPHEIRDRLTAALAPYRNREAAFALAVFLGRFHSAPGRIIDAFPIDRRALAGRPDLGLTEDRVRGAIRTLEAVGFLDRTMAGGSTHQKTSDGELHRKPILFQIGSEYAPGFRAANRRAAAARDRCSGERRAPAPFIPPRASMAHFRASPLNSPKATSVEESHVPMGDTTKQNGIPPQTSEPNPRLEAALDQLLQGIRQARGGSGQDSAR